MAVELLVAGEVDGVFQVEGAVPFEFDGEGEFEACDPDAWWTKRTGDMVDTWKGSAAGVQVAHLRHRRGG